MFVNVWAGGCLNGAYQCPFAFQGTASLFSWDHVALKALQWESLVKHRLLTSSFISGP